MRTGNLLIRTLLGALLSALGVAACGSPQKPRSFGSDVSRPAVHRPQIFTIYSGLPHRGSERFDSQQIERGIDLAVRAYDARRPTTARIRYVALPDSARPAVRHVVTPQSPTLLQHSGSRTSSRTGARAGGGGWDAAQAVASAHTAARDPQTVAYIGDLDSGATELSLPILNQAGIVQITPGSPYPGLTDAYRGVTQATVEPGRYYPQPPRTLLRLIPSDVIQASAALEALNGGGCSRVAAWKFGSSAETTALYNAVALTAPRYGMTFVRPPALPSRARDYVTYAYSLKPLDIHCAVLVGHVTADAVVLTTELREQLAPNPTIVGTSGFCTPDWLAGVAKPLMNTVAAGLSCTTPLLPLDRPNYPGHKQFIASFRRAYHRLPGTYAYYGYEAAEMVIRAVEDAVGTSDVRDQVRVDIYDGLVTGAHDPFRFDSHGDVQSTAFGIDTFVHGRPVWQKTVTPTNYLLPSPG